MKKYKLIKEYPGSPKLGAIEYVKQESETGFYSDNPEFWEEVVEKDYEILSFSSKEEFQKGRILTILPQLFEIDNYINSPDTLWNIHSVKRLSDGEIFTVSDEIIIRNISVKINLFFIKNNKLYVDTRVSNQGDELSNIKKYKLPLFTTEDGVDIFEGDTNVDVYYCNKNGFKLSHCCKTEILPNSFSKNNLYFKSKKVAEEYILMNKPCLSVNDINGLKCLTFSNWDKYLKELVKQKLKND